MQQEDIEMPSVEQNNENEDIVVKSDDRNGGGERQIQLHPLVLFNIADHFTRQKCNIQLEHSHKNEGTTISTSSVLPQVIGALFGIQNGLEVFVHDSFEMKYEVKNGEIVLDKEFLNARIQQCEFQLLYYKTDIYRIF
jgi:hypothetical protein